jgi:hypothetical protein
MTTETIESVQMNKYRFYDILVENEDGSEANVQNEFVLDLPKHDMSTPVERQEFLGIMCDAVTAASGMNICSFRSEPVNL